MVRQDLEAATDEEQEVDIVSDAQPGGKAEWPYGRFEARHRAGRQRRETAVPHCM